MNPASDHVEFAANAIVELDRKPLFSVSSNAMIGSIQKSSQMPVNLRCTRFSAAMSRSKVSFIVMAGDAFKASSMPTTPSTYESIIGKTCLLELTAISTESSPSGLTLNYA